MDKTTERKFRTCFISKCPNNTSNAPEKIYIAVPRKTSEAKAAWFKCANKRLPESSSSYFCCEDHFNLEEDSENYVRHKMTGCRIIIKKGVVPHIFDTHVLNPFEEELKRKRLVADALEEYNGNISSPFELEYRSAHTSKDEPATTLPTTEQNYYITSTHSDATPLNTLPSRYYIPQKIATRSIGIQVKPQMKSKGTTFKPSVADKNLAPIKWKRTRDAATSPIRFPTYKYSPETSNCSEVISSDGFVMSEHSTNSSESDD